MQIIAIVLARLDSMRLPNKALIELQGKTIINHVISRAGNINGIEKVVLATTNRDIDDKLANEVSSYGIDVYRGSTNDVALRMLECAKVYDASFFIRINGDSPFLDPALISTGLACCANDEFDLITNLAGRTFPYGISVEILSTERYGRIYKSIKNDVCFEHPTKYIYENSEKMKIKVITSKYPELNKARLVIDTPDDLMICKKIMTILGSRVYGAKYNEVAQIYLDIKRGEK
ncbi:MAG: NTP transferase domain-containing protein [Candidatus Aureabacteria bacterium]|nr:NTP transferase domain-containing protein [Candidatus Auribacterota bacterium]